MVAHVVLLKPRATMTDGDREALLDAMRVAFTGIPEIRRVRIGKRILLGRGYETQMAEQIAGSSATAIKLSRLIISHLSRPAIHASMDDEMIYQTYLNRSDDMAEFRAARAENRRPNYSGS